VSNHARNRGAVNLIKKRTRAEEAQYDTVGLCLAFLQDQVQGGSATREAMLGDIMSDSPERMASMVLTMLAMVRDLADRSPGGFMMLCDYLVDTIPERA
jgi:hypothetical protein